MHFATFTPFRAVVACPCTTLWTGLQGATVQYHRTGIFGSSCLKSQHHAQVIHQRLEHASFYPSLRLLIYHLPRRQVMWHHPPGNTRLDKVAQPIEHLSQTVFSLWCILFHQRQVGRYERPFFITYVGWITSLIFHLPTLALNFSKVHNRLYAAITGE